MDHSASDVTVDDLGNEYVKISSNCTHFKTFKGFSAQDAAYERWLEHLVESLARKPDNGSKSTSKCFKCGATGHWVRDCPTSEQCSATAESSSSKSGNDYDYPCMSETAKVKREIMRKAHKPRVLSKAPPRRQPSVKDCIERVRG
jgi:hypothetical protein